MATKSTLAKQLNDITECSICSDQFTDPRSLPCVHTYCLKCIERHADGRTPGKRIPCPLCRKEFTVPAGGMIGLPKNFFIEKMLNRKRLATNQDTPSTCEACDTDETDESENASATAYCVDCQEKLCDECARYHKKCKTARSHRIVKLDENGRLRNEEIVGKSVPSMCERHEDQNMAIFCRDCKMAICVVCYIGTHKQHNCSDIKDVVEKFQEQMKTDAGNLAERIKQLEEWLTTLEERREGFRTRVAVTREEILKKSEELQQIIERNTIALIDDLEISSDQVVKKLDHLTEDITQQVSLMENLKKYTEELCTKGTDGDIAYGTGALRNRTEEMLNLDNIKQVRDDMDHFIDIKFTASSLVTEDADINVVGTMELTDCKPCAPKLSRTLPSTGHHLAGVTSLANQLFVVRYGLQQIEVYDTTTFTLQRNIPVSGLLYARGLVSCVTNNCLYASNHSVYTVVRIDLTNGSVTNWATGTYPTGLFVNNANNLLVSCYNIMQLREYTTQGTAVRTITLPSMYPLHAIQITEDQYVVSHINRVCVVDVNGQVVRMTDESIPFNNPAGIVQLKSGCILVANQHLNKLTLLNPALSRARDFPIPADTGLQHPWTLWLDELRGRLYVGELVQDIVFTFLMMFLMWVRVSTRPNSQ